MESNITERDRALKILEEQIFTISSTYRESYLAHGKGALIVYTDLLDNNLAWSSINYRNKKECLEFFDNMKSRKKLGRLIDNYDPQTEGIVIIINVSSTSACTPGISIPGVQADVELTLIYICYLMQTM